MTTLVSCLSIMLLLPTGQAFAQQTDTEADITHFHTETPGIEAEVGTFESSGEIASGAGSRPTGSQTFTSTSAGSAAPSAPTPVALVPHTCAPVFGTGGVSLTYNFSDAGAGDCLSFSAPTPVPAPDPPGPGRPRRDRGPSIAALVRIAADRAMALAPSPQLEIAPDGVGLTGLASYFWLAEAPGTISATASAGGTVVTAQALPVQYVWSFGDGSDQVTHSPGRAWTKTRPGSIDHTYEARGRYDVAVEVIWQARWNVDAGPWRDLGFFSTADARTYPVRQIIAVLVKPD
jgi:hypothetical protein